MGDNSKTPIKNQKKCYNTFSCVMSVLIIIFVVGAIMWDMFISKPMIYDSIETIKTEVRVINRKIDTHYNLQNGLDSLYNVELADSAFVSINEFKETK